MSTQYRFSHLLSDASHLAFRRVLLTWGGRAATFSFFFSNSPFPTASNFHFLTLRLKFISTIFLSSLCLLFPHFLSPFTTLPTYFFFSNLVTDTRFSSQPKAIQLVYFNTKAMRRTSHTAKHTHTDKTSVRSGTYSLHNTTPASCGLHRRSGPLTVKVPHHSHCTVVLPGSC